MEEVTRRVTNNTGHKVVLKVNCDMSGLTSEQIEEYAFDSIWIAEQARLREMSDKNLDALNGEYTFTAVEKSRTKGPRDPLKAAIKAIPKMSDEEKAKLLAALKAAK
jgi:hypothetical protein